MDVKGAVLDLSTIRSISKQIDTFDYSEDYLAGVNGFNTNPLKRFKKEFPDVIKALSVLDDILFKPKKILDTQEFVIHFENDVAEMDCVTFLDIDGTPFFVDIEVKETEHLDQLREQFTKRETDNLPQLNVNENYILLGFLKGSFKMGVVKESKIKQEIKNITELMNFISKRNINRLNIIPLIKAVEGILKIQDVKKKIQDNVFKYYSATKDAIDFTIDNIKNGKNVAIIYGNAGSGKTVIALSLFFGIKNAKFLLLNKNLYSSLSMYQYYSVKKCFYGTDQFIDSIDDNTIAIVDECQRLSLSDILRISQKAKATVLLGDNNQAFAYGDSLFNENELRDYIVNNSAIDIDKIAVKRLKKTARYNSKVNKLLESLHNTYSINNYKDVVNDKVGDEFAIDVTMSEESFISKFNSISSTSKIYMPLISVRDTKISIGGRDFNVAGIEDGDFSFRSYYENYIGNTFHAISFDIDNSFVFLKGVGVLKRGDELFLYEKSKDESTIDENYLKKFSNQINILFTRGRKSLHILADDFYTYSYLNFKIKKGIK